MIKWIYILFYNVLVRKINYKTQIEQVQSDDITQFTCSFQTLFNFESMRKVSRIYVKFIWSSSVGTLVYNISGR